MKKLFYIAFFSITTCLLIACGAYSFTGVTTDAESIQVDFFPNQAPIVEPNLTQRFTNDLQDLFTRQTNLTLVSSNGELHLSGEIIGYRITPLSGTAQQTAAQNRLTVTINVRFVNTKNEKEDFERTFPFYSDFDASSQLTGSVLETALDEIIDRITQDIFNAALGNW